MTIALEALLSGSVTVDWDDTAMSGTSKRVTEAIELGSGALAASWQPAWTKTTGVTGAFGVELSNDGIEWTPGVADTDFNPIGPAVDDNTDAQTVHGRFRARYARLAYTNATNTGVLTDGVHVSAKVPTRSSGVIAVTAASLMGDSGRLAYDSSIFTPGTGGVAIGPDQVNLNGGGEYDLVNPTSGERPDPDTSTGFDSWLFARANGDDLGAFNAATELFAVGEFPWVAMVIKHVTTNTTQGHLELTDGAVNNGGGPRLSSANNMRAQWRTASRSFLSATVGFTSTDIVIIEADLMTDRTRLRVDGAITDTSVSSTGGLVNAIDSVEVGTIASGGWNIDAHVYEIAVGESPPEDTKTAVRDLWAAKFGVALS